MRKPLPLREVPAKNEAERMDHTVRRTLSVPKAAIPQGEARTRQARKSAKRR